MKRVAGIFALLAAVLAGPINASAASGDVPAYLAGNAHANFNPAETSLNPATFPTLRPGWFKRAGGPVWWAQPIVADGTVYWGSMDGREHATTVDGRDSWTANLGTSKPQCGTTLGVASTPVIATVNGVATLFVGGGNSRVYALNAGSGAVLWSTAVPNPPLDGSFVWSSPILSNGHLYVGVAAQDDCPLVQGQLVQLDAASGAVQNVYKVVPDGCEGSGIWGSPTVDDAAGAIYVATGNGGDPPDNAYCPGGEPNALSVLKLRATDLALLDHWRVPDSEHGNDSDFGATPTLFTAGGVPMVGVANKAGLFFALRRGNLGAGPTWAVRIGDGGAGPGSYDSGSTVASSGFDGSQLYLAGAAMTLNGSRCQAPVFAVDPLSGAPRWSTCAGGWPIVGAPMVVPGALAVASGHDILLLRAGDGSPQGTFRDPNGLFLAPPTISGGTLYAGNSDGRLFALGIPSPTPAVTAVMGTDGGMWVHRDGVAGYSNYGGGLLAAPAVIDGSAPGSPSHVFIATGTDHDLWVRDDTHGWQLLDPAGSLYCIDNPAAALVGAPGAQTLYIACEGADQALWYSAVPFAAGSLPVAPGSGWTSLGGQLTAGPAIAAVGGGPVFFGRAPGGQVYRETPQDGWTPSGWFCTGHPAALTVGATTHFGCRGTDGALWSSTTTGGGAWIPAVSMGGVVVDGPAIAATGTNVTYFVAGGDGAVWHASMLGGAFSSFVSDGGQVLAGVGASS